MREAFAGLLLIWLVITVLMPEYMGQSARNRYDLFMIGWNNPDAPRQ